MSNESQELGQRMMVDDLLNGGDTYASLMGQIEDMSAKLAQRDMEIEALKKSPVRPCPICGEHCSGCLEDLAAKQEGLRELLSYCRSAADGNRNGDLEAAGASLAFEDVAKKLAPLLDGES